MQNRFTEIKRKILDERFSHLNDMQRKVVYAVSGPVLILAGAGSGKTTAITNRISYMIKYGDSYNSDYLPVNISEELLDKLENNQNDFYAESLLCHNPVNPYSILAITFTNKAAGEMRERIERLAGAAAGNMWILTFHSACVRILRQDIERLGYDSSFAIYDAADSKTLIKDCMNELYIDEKQISYRVFQSVISSCKDKYIFPSEFSEYFEDNPVNRQIEKVYRLYQEKLKKCNALDFDDIIMLTVKLFLNNEDILSKWQDRFKYIVVDEYQDTSKIQYMLISCLGKRSRNVCVVGDDDQSIYKFRGADIENILSFEKQFKDALVIKLEQNYRSTANILNAANAVISNNGRRKQKRLWTDKPKGEKIKRLLCFNEREEADKVGKIIEDYVRSGGRYCDCAILYRMNAQSRAVEENFLRNGIPHRVVGGLRFFDRKEIKDIVAYMRLGVNGKDDVSFKRIINEPKRGIGKTAMERMEKIAADENKSLFEVAENVLSFPELTRYSKELLSFVRLIYDFKVKADDIEEYANTVIEGSGYKTALMAENTVEARTRLENVDELMSMVKEYKGSLEDSSVSGFLENMALLSDIDNYDDMEDAVVLMSMHSAKGLEFDRVFILGCEEGIFPSSRSMASSEELEEERRLMYVAVTRAKEVLYITTTSQRMIFGNTMYSRDSRFLSEIPSEYMEFENKQTEKTVNDDFGIFSFNKPRAFGALPKDESPKVFTVNYGKGDRVNHKKFGNGTVIDAVKLGNDYKVTVSFDSGETKNLMAAFAKLEKI